MNDDLQQLLKNLRLTKIAEILDEQVAAAEAESLPVKVLLARLLRAEWHHRQESALTTRIKRAGMPESWTIESFPPSSASFPRPRISSSSARPA